MSLAQILESNRQQQRDSDLSGRDRQFAQARRRPAAWSEAPLRRIRAHGRRSLLSRDGERAQPVGPVGAYRRHRAQAAAKWTKRVIERRVAGGGIAMKRRRQMADPGA